DFNIIYVLGKKNIIANALLRRLEEDNWQPLAKTEEEVNSFINIALSSLHLYILITN
ncbi:hypothetical protein T440DRAFT_384389, partial [Plenodomus tracheiphilus IPT5]